MPPLSSSTQKPSKRQSLIRMWLPHLAGTFQPYLKPSVRSEGDTIERDAVVVPPAEMFLGKTT